MIHRIRLKEHALPLGSIPSMLYALMCIIADVSAFCAIILLVLLKDINTLGDFNVSVTVLPLVYSMTPKCY